MENELKEFGLTDKEVKVYIACLKLGISSVQQISKEAGTYRTYTYEILKSLKEKGLVSYIIRLGKQYFEVSEPDKLINILKEKENKIKSILPDLKILYNTQFNKPSIEMFEGKEGLKNIMDGLIRTKEEILFYGSTGKQVQALNFYFPNYIKRRVEEKIKIKVLTEQSKENFSLHKEDKKELREMRFLPKGVDFPTATYIYGNTVAMFSLEKNIISLIIGNEDIAKTHRMIFNMMWDQSINKKGIKK